VAASPDSHHNIPTTDPGCAPQKVKVHEFQVRDVVLKRVIQTTWQIDQGKLGPNWEGPYTIIAWRGKGSYILADQDRKLLKK